MRTFEVSRRGGSGVDVGGGPLWPPAVACLIGSPFWPYPTPTGGHKGPHSTPHHSRPYARWHLCSPKIYP